MLKFETAIATVLKNEDSTLLGKVTKDSGGLTKYGISQKAYPHLDIQSLTLSEAKVIYKRDYYNALKLDQINDQKVVTKLLDMAVNSGVNRTTRMVQHIIGVEVDGRVGPRTIAVINKQEPSRLLREIRDKQKAHYMLLVENNPTKYGKYLTGWLIRVDTC